MHLAATPDTAIDPDAFEREALAELGMPRERWSMAFQSRLGRAKWIEPYTDVALKDLASRGVKKLLVACPAFVADCIETLEEIGIRGRETFLAAGGESLTLGLDDIIDAACSGQAGAA